MFFRYHNMLIWLYHYRVSRDYPAMSQKGGVAGKWNLAWLAKRSCGYLRLRLFGANNMANNLRERFE